jgi:CBS domain-containing protein
LTENQYQIGTTATDSTYVEDCMTRKPIVIYEDATVGDALELCGTHQIGDLPVLDGSNYPLGMISLKDLTRLVL